VSNVVELQSRIIGFAQDAELGHRRNGYQVGDQAMKITVEKNKLFIDSIEVKEPYRTTVSSDVYKFSSLYQEQGEGVEIDDYQIVIVERSDHKFSVIGTPMGEHIQCKGFSHSLDPGQFKIGTFDGRDFVPVTEADLPREVRGEVFADFGIKKFHGHPVMFKKTQKEFLETLFKKRIRQVRDALNKCKDVERIEECAEILGV